MENKKQKKILLTLEYTFLEKKFLNILSLE